MVIENAIADLKIPPSAISNDAIQAAIFAARDPADLEARLAILLRDADHQAQHATLEKALFAAEVLGYLHAAPGSAP